MIVNGYKHSYKLPITIVRSNNIYGTITNQGISISLNLSYNTLVVGSSTRTFIYKFVNNQFVLNQDLNQGVTSLYLTYNANYLIVSYTFSYFRSFIVYELQQKQIDVTSQ
jgi:nucleoside-diphosphate-sugar epimerase